MSTAMAINSNTADATAKALGIEEVIERASSCNRFVDLDRDSDSLIDTDGHNW